MKELKHKKEDRKKKKGDGDDKDGKGQEKKASTRSEPTKRLACTCHHTFQDREYGRGVRLMNRAGKAGKGSVSRMYRCTSCTRTVTL